MFFGSSITRITKHHVRSATRVEELLAAHPDNDSIWNNTDPYDVSLDNTSATKGPISIDVTKEPVKATTAPILIEIDNNTNVAQCWISNINTLNIGESVIVIRQLWKQIQVAVANFVEWEQGLCISNQRQIAIAKHSRQQ